MKSTLELEYDVAISKLVDVFSEYGITADDINTLRIKSQRIVESNGNPIYLSDVFNWLENMMTDSINEAVYANPAAAPAPQQKAGQLSPQALLQQKQTLDTAIRNYFGRLFQMGAGNANVFMGKMLTSVNNLTKDMLAKKFGIGGKPAAPAPGQKVDPMMAKLGQAAQKSIAPGQKVDPMMAKLGQASAQATKPQMPNLQATQQVAAAPATSANWAY